MGEQNGDAPGTGGEPRHQNYRGRFDALPDVGRRAFLLSALASAGAVDGVAAFGNDPGRADRRRAFEVTKGDQPAGTATYVLAVDGWVEPTGGSGDTVCPNHDPPFVTGRVGPTGGTDTVEFAGDVVLADLFGPAELYVDGQRTAPSAVGPGLSNTLVVTREGVRDGRTEYGVAVSGVLAPGPDVEDTNPSTGCGALLNSLSAGDGTDTVHFSGGVTDFTLDGPATVYLDGEEVDPDDPESESGDVTVERVTPVDADVTVAPIPDFDSLLFEVAARGSPGELWPSVTFEWYVDGEQQYVDGPWHWSYHGDHMDFFRPRFSSEGTHEVRVDVYDENGETRFGSTTWTVHVEGGSHGRPSAERVSPAAERVEVGEGESIDLTLSAGDPGGDLHRVIWWSGMCDDLVRVTDLRGAEARDTLRDYGTFGCPVIVWVVDERGTTATISWIFDVERSDG